MNAPFDTADAFAADTKPVEKVDVAQKIKVVDRTRPDVERDRRLGREKLAKSLAVLVGEGLRELEPFTFLEGFPRRPNKGRSDRYVLRSHSGYGDPDQGIKLGPFSTIEVNY